MDALWLAFGTGVTLVVALLLRKKVRYVGQWVARGRFLRFNRLVVTVEQTNEAYFRSLEAMLKTLECLRARTDEAEQRLWGIVAQPADERRERREAAGLFVGADVDAAALSKMLQRSVGQRRSRQKPKRGITPKQSRPNRSRTNGARIEPAPVAFAPAPAKAPRPVPRAETGAENRSDTASAENKKSRLNGFTTE